MKLNDFDKVETARLALQQTFNTTFDPSKLDKASTRSMLVKVKNLMAEAKQEYTYSSNAQNPSYLKLLLIAESLTNHYKNFKNVEIVLENEQVERSEVILAAQDMVDSVQKMVEQVNDMLVKELPALTDRIQTEIGVNESTSFNQQASQALTSLNQALSQSRQTLQTALNTLTGVQSPDAFGGGAEKAVTDITTSQPMPGGGEEVTNTELATDLPAEEPEDLGPVGRAKRA